MVNGTPLAHGQGLDDLNAPAATDSSLPGVHSPQSSQSDNSQISEGEDAEVNVQDANSTDNANSAADIDPDQDTPSEPFLASLREICSRFATNDWIPFCALYEEVVQSAQHFVKLPEASEQPASRKDINPSNHKEIQRL